MASIVSPTPMGSSQAPPLTRRTSQRQASLRRPPSRSLRRHESNPVPTTNSQSQYSNMHDSSDDEMPVPMKLSALTKALLDDGAPAVPPPAPRTRQASNPPVSPPRTRRRSALSSSTSSAQEESRRQLRSGSSQPYYETNGRSSRVTSPAKSRESSPVRKRVVRLSTTPKSLSQMKRRSTSSQSRPSLQRKPSTGGRPPSRDKSSSSDINKTAPAPPPVAAAPPADINTPAQQPRVVRIASGSSAVRGRSATSSAVSSVKSTSASQTEAEGPEEPGTAARNSGHLGSVSRAGNIGRLEDNLALQSSMRIKRVGKVPGSFLSGPARRGRRRQSEEDVEGNGEGEPMSSSQEPESQKAEPTPGTGIGDGLGTSFYSSHKYTDFASGSPVSSKDLHRRHASLADMRMASSARPSPMASEPEPEPEPARQAAARQQPPAIPSTHDQENEVPLSIRQSKPLPLSTDILADKLAKRPASTDLGASRATASPERKPLSSINHNTPHRPAPPPPKMSVVDVATSSAGAVTTQVKQRRNVIRVNGKCYTRLDVLGRGGSAKVYRVTAENGRMWALKRVSLEHADELTIKGFKSEIDLLTKLANVERVINLLDYEMNDEKKVLTLVSRSMLLWPPNLI